MVGAYSKERGDLNRTSRGDTRRKKSRITEGNSLRKRAIMNRLHKKYEAEEEAEDEMMSGAGLYEDERDWDDNDDA